MNTDWYISSIRREIERMSDDFYGDVSFKISFLNGNIAHMNIGLNKSIKQVKQSPLADQKRGHKR